MAARATMTAMVIMIVRFFEEVPKDLDNILEIFKECRLGL